MIWLLVSYLVSGMIFAIWFLAVALPGRDANAAGTGFYFRLMVFPSCILLWPVLLYLFRRGARHGSVHGEWRHADHRLQMRHARVWMLLPLALLVLLTLAIVFRSPINIRP